MNSGNTKLNCLKHIKTTLKFPKECLFTKATVVYVLVIHLSFCVASCKCSASGDPHYLTYDGMKIHYMGTCMYTLTKSTTINDPCAFNVEVKNEHRKGKTHVSYTRMAFIEILNKRIELLQDKVVKVSSKDYLHFSLSSWITRNLV